jgi:hypothetical protein
VGHEGCCLAGWQALGWQEGREGRQVLLPGEPLPCLLPELQALRLGALLLMGGLQQWCAAPGTCAGEEDPVLVGHQVGWQPISTIHKTECGETAVLCFRCA